MAPCDDRDPTLKGSRLKTVTQADFRSNADTSSQELLILDQMGLNFLRVQNGHQMLPHYPVSSSPSGRAKKASSLLQKAHVNILFEFPTSQHNSYLTSWLKGES